MEIKGEVTLLNKMIIIVQCLFHFMLVTIKAKPMTIISKEQTKLKVKISKPTLKMTRQNCTSHYYEAS